MNEFLTLNKSITFFQIVFADDSIGFEQEFSERVFNIFHRLHDKQTYNWKGIGLTIWKIIIKNQQRIIFANNIPASSPICLTEN
ncbi:hypothetical protein BH11BAC1_BH11BAC1_09410 [soil metagenome]